jgi:osomolarity two-component system, sensor histidine kinase SLN1
MLKLEQILQVTIAEDGQEALDLVRTRSSHAGESMDDQIVDSSHAVDQETAPFDLIFMDIQMPNMDGIAATKHIRELGCSTPIIALTAFAEKVNEESCYKSGMDFFLAKPLQRPKLKETLQRFYSSRSTKAEGSSEGTSQRPADSESRCDAPG